MSPMQSSTLETLVPLSSSCRRGTTGLRRNLSSGPSLGRPRWDVSSTLAPLSTRYLRVGIAARMRVSSVILRSLSSGTLRSARTWFGREKRVKKKGQRGSKEREGGRKSREGARRKAALPLPLQASLLPPFHGLDLAFFGSSFQISSSQRIGSDVYQSRTGRESKMRRVKVPRKQGGDIPHVSEGRWRLLFFLFDVSCKFFFEIASPRANSNSAPQPLKKTHQDGLALKLRLGQVTWRDGT